MYEHFEDKFKQQNQLCIVHSLTSALLVLFLACVDRTFNNLLIESGVIEYPIHKVLRME